jgi:hypothetical protein
MHRVRTSLPALAVLAALATTASPAHAASGSYVVRGGCAYDTVENATEPGVQQGVVYATVVLASETVSDEPVSATVTCEVWVDGVLQQASSFDGTGVVTGAAPLRYHKGPCQSDYLHVTVDLTSDDTPTDDYWVEADYVMIPPQEVTDVVRELGVPLPPGCE